MSKASQPHMKGYFGNLPSNYLPNLGKELLVKKISSRNIQKDSFGNCNVSSKTLEANACSLIKDDYKKP